VDEEASSPEQMDRMFFLDFSLCALSLFLWDFGRDMHCVCSFNDDRQFHYHLIATKIH
jgi:hypothetical protein